MGIVITRGWLVSQAMGRHWEEALLLRVAYNAELRMQRRLPSTYFGPKEL